MWMHFVHFTRICPYQMKFDVLISCHDVFGHQYFSLAYVDAFL